MTIQVFVTSLLALSIFTSLTTQAIKVLLKEFNKKVYTNTLASIVSVVLGIATGVGYGILSKVTFDIQYIIVIVALTFLSFLCATNGYDKVKQAIEQVFGK